MKRKYIILGSVFIFFLVLGIWLNGQKGMNLMSDFWVLKKDGRRFEITLGETSFTATIEEREDGWYMESDKGWGIKIPLENYLSVVVNGTIWMGDAQVTIHDPEAMGLHFEIFLPLAG